MGLVGMGVEREQDEEVEDEEDVDEEDEDEEDVDEEDEDEEEEDVDEEDDVGMCPRVPPSVPPVVSEERTNV